MTEKILSRLKAGLNYACTYEKTVEVNGNSDIIEEFDIADCSLILYCKNNDYIINFENIKCEVNGVRVEFIFIGKEEFKLLI